MVLSFWTVLTCGKLLGICIFVFFFFKDRSFENSLMLLSENDSFCTEVIV